MTWTHFVSTMESMNATERRAAVTRIVSTTVEVEREDSTETVEVFGNVLMPASPSDEMAVRVTSVVSHFSGRSQAEQWTTKVQEQFEAALIDEACVQADAAPVRMSMVLGGAA